MVSPSAKGKVYINKKGNSWVFINKNYGIPFKHAMPGDLVMVHASGIKHPALAAEIIDRY